MKKLQAAGLALCSLLLWAAAPANAVLAPWSTSVSVGPNQVVYTLDLICTTGGLVCDALDAYSDQQTAQLTGSGQLDLDLDAGTLQFQSDGVVDLIDGMGLRPTYATGQASDLVFASIPFIGAPETELGAIFALTNPIFSAGAAPLQAGAYPISAVVSYSAIADIVGPVDAYLAGLLLTPNDVTLSGTLQVLGFLPQGVVYELRDMTASVNVQNPTTLLGEDVTVSVTADMTMNLSGFVAGQFTPPTVVPGLGGFGIGALALTLCFAGRYAGTKTNTKTNAKTNAKSNAKSPSPSRSRASSEETA